MRSLLSMLAALNLRTDRAITVREGVVVLTRERSRGGKIDLGESEAYSEFVTKDTIVSERSSGMEAAQSASALHREPADADADALVVYPYRRFLAMQSGTLAVTDFVRDLIDHVDRQLPAAPSEPDHLHA